MTNILLLIKEYCLKFVTKESNYSHIVMSKEFESLDQALMVEVIRRKQGGASIGLFRPKISPNLCPRCHLKRISVQNWKKNHLPNFQVNGVWSDDP